MHDPVYLSVHLRAVDCVAPECEVNWDRISGGEPVARGAAGQVCKMQLDGKMVAVKQFTGLEALAQNESAEVHALL